MGKGKNDGKDIYRKKAFSGKIIRNLEKEYLDFSEELRKIPPKPPINKIKFVIEKFEKNPDLKVTVLFCKNEELREILIDLGNRGANLTTIWDALKIPDIAQYLIKGHPVGFKYYEGELSPHWNEAIKNFSAKKKRFLKEEKAIKNAIRLITTMQPITLESLSLYRDELPIVNGKLLMAQRELNGLNRVIDIYLNAKAIKDGLIGYPAKWGLPIKKLVREKFRPLTQRSHSSIWNRRIVILVNELKRIGYSDRQSYIKTGKLLNLAFPLFWKDDDADLVRQRYTHQTPKK